MLNKELDLVKSVSSTLSSFKQDPTLAARSIHTEDSSTRDPDVWPPPTPAEGRLAEGMTLIC